MAGTVITVVLLLFSKSYPPPSSSNFFIPLPPFIFLFNSNATLKNRLRDKQETFESSLQLGKKLREITRRAGVPFVVNDDVALAKALHADGVHVGQEDTLAVDARAALGPSAIVGVSAGTSEEARQAIADGADYIGVGAVFATPSKADAGDPIGPHGLHEIVDAVEGQIPVVAIGGISVDNAQQCWEAGASGVAVISAVMKSEVPGVSAAQLHRQK